MSQRAVPKGYAPDTASQNWLGPDLTVQPEDCPMKSVYSTSTRQPESGIFFFTHYVKLKTRAIISLFLRRDFVEKDKTIPGSHKKSLIQNFHTIFTMRASVFKGLFTRKTGRCAPSPPHPHLFILPPDESNDYICKIRKNPSLGGNGKSASQ